MTNQEQMPIDLNNQQLATKTLEVPSWQLVVAKNTWPRGGLPSDINPNPKQVNIVSTYNVL